MDSVDELDNVDNVEDEISNDEFQSNISNLIMDADQIKFGSELEEITETVYLPESEQRFGIEKQLSDLLDEMLSTRAMLKKASKQYRKQLKDPPAAVLRQLEARQLALKYVANVTCR